ncbi:MAG: ATP-binding protein [Defluviitaleaceae bacterium]|nr:ATP-binding protein [Defluviitaleaceae bacterium]
MTLLKESSIRRRLYLGFACMWAIMIFFAFFRGQQLNTVMDRYNEAMTTLNVRQQCIGNMVTALSGLRFDSAMFGALTEYPDFYELVMIKDRSEYKESLQQCLANHRSLILNDSLLSEAGKSEYLEILDYIYHNLHQHYFPSSDNVLAIIENGDSEALAEALYLNFTIGAYIQDLVWELRDKTFAFSSYITETMREHDGADERLFNIATMLGISIAILLALILAHTIQKPISQLRFAVGEVTSGNMEYPIRMKYSDDIGRLSHDVADMVESISDMINTTAEQKHRIAQEQLHKQLIQQALEESQAASKAKSAFIANTSHEIRTPMNSIIGYAELALDDTISDETREHISNVISGAKWLLNIINNIMDFSKIESGGLELERVSFSVNKITDHCLSLLKPTALSKSIKLNLRTDLSPDKRFIGDPTKLSQVIINLLSNALKFTHEGSVTLLVSTIDTKSDDVTLKFEVKDTGIGMTEEQVSKVFEPFMQADPSTTRKYGGTGLGLAIAKRLIEAMGGELDVESTENKGSAFSFALVFKAAKEIEFSATLADEKATIEKPSFDKGEILIVDDIAMNIGVTSTHLQRVGLSCFVAKNGKEAVEMVKSRAESGKKPYDLIFMDIHMPEMDGREAAAIINELNTGTPVIAMTAGNLSQTEEASYKNCGMVDYISKPFTSQELWKLLIKYL